MNWLRMRKVKHGNCIVLKLNDLIQLNFDTSLFANLDSLNDEALENSGTGPGQTRPLL
jgi:hypothetical protein